jgi:fatty-acyl-CoA synthase
VVTKPGQQVSDVDIKALLKEFAAKGIISKYCVPVHVVFVDTLPKTSVGKLDKKVLRQTYAG